MKWMPISTAPKDKPFIGWDGESIDIFYWDKGCWRTDYWQSADPTHWMPLPEPPQSLSASSSADER